MSETLQYIESYFQNELSHDERLAFENRCTTDQSFAGEVAFYVASRQALKDNLLQNKQKEWVESSIKDEWKSGSAVRKIYQQPLFRYAAAASVIILVALYLEITPANPQQLAEDYINLNYQHLGQKMSAASDSIELGIAAYNSKDYVKAANIFEVLNNANPGNAELIKYRGLVYLQLNYYDKAIAAFDSLASTKNLHSNPGLLLQAAALLKRGDPGDVETSKLLLQRVIIEDKEGKDEAEKWIKYYK